MKVAQRKGFWYRFNLGLPTTQELDMESPATGFRKMHKIAFLTMDSLEGFVSYDGLVRDILLGRGVQVDEVSWRAKNIDWDQYQLVIIRSPWDYQKVCDQFLATLATIDASRARLLNSLKTVRWNVQKSYLQELESQGISIVPTRWVSSPETAELMRLFGSFSADEIVIKPVVGAGAEDTFRLRPKSPPEIFENVVRVFSSRSAMVQPFIANVVSYGEVSLIYFNGQFSHCVLKTPKSGDFRVQEEHGGFIQLITPDDSLLVFAERSLAAAPDDTLYARVDVVFLDDQQPAIMELELIEPSLYLSYDSQSSTRFADAIQAVL